MGKRVGKLVGERVGNLVGKRVGKLVGAYVAEIPTTNPKGFLLRVSVLLPSWDSVFAPAHLICQIQVGCKPHCGHPLLQ